MQSIPVETLEGIVILGAVQITTQCIEECLKRGIPVSYFSKGGSYFGRLVSTGHRKPELQRKQAALYDSPFALELSKRIVEAKVRNQLVLLKRYARSAEVDIAEEEKMLKISAGKARKAKEIPELMGYEGMGAKYYFQGHSRCVREEFSFPRRSRRPPKDEFNAMLSLGYSILMNEVYGAIEMRGLNPYFGFFHRDSERHPTLASDMMEEWRPVLVDALVMSMINGHEVEKEEFYREPDQPGVYLAKPALKKFLTKMEKKFQTESRYLPFVDHAVSFRRGIALQLHQLELAIEAGDPEMYEPVKIR